MSDSTKVSAQALDTAVGYRGYFTLAFGAIVGSGWVVVMGDWLKTAGPGGTAVGFFAGSIVMVLIALCYGELAARFPTAGAEFLYTLQTFGPRTGFLVGWFITLYAVSVCAFEGIACGWFLTALFPTFRLGTAYTLAGSHVTWNALLIGTIAALGIGTLHYLGARSAILFQNVVTFAFIAVSLLLILCGFARGSSANLQPIFASGSGGDWIGGACWVFATCSFFLNGWQTSLHAIEERASGITPGGAIASITAAIIASAAFYIGIVLAAGQAVPWRGLIARDLPAVSAFGALGFHGLLATVILIAATVSLWKTWSAMTWVASRVLYAQAKHGMIPAALGKTDSRTRAPRIAIAAVTAVTLIGIALGRGAILPIVDMVSICLALSMILCLAALLRRRASDSCQPAFAVPGGTPVIIAALAGASMMIGIALVRPLLSAHGKIPLEWILLAAWAALGFSFLIAMPHIRRLAPSLWCNSDEVNSTSQKPE